MIEREREDEDVKILIWKHAKMKNVKMMRVDLNL